MSILVTGAAGFIGSHFCEALLRQGQDVVGVDNMNQFYDPELKQANLIEIERTADAAKRNFSFYAVDIRHQEPVRQILANHDVSAIVHLAAMAGVRPSLENPLLYEEVNQLGTLTLLEESRARGIKKFVFASSSSVYGNNPKAPFCESDPVDNPISVYAATKKAGELTCHVYHKLYGMSVACLRFFTVYGPRQRPDLSIHKFTRLIFDGKKIPVYGDGTKRRDFTYVDDTIDGVTKALNWLESEALPRYEIFNLGESRTVSVNELIALIEQSLGIKAERDTLPDAPGDVDVTFADITKAKSLLGYAPRIAVEDGIPRFVDWFKKANGI